MPWIGPSPYTVVLLLATPAWLFSSHNTLAFGLAPASTSRHIHSSSMMWRRKCLVDFELAPLPPPTTSKRIDDCNHDDHEMRSPASDKTWERYHEYRTRVEREASIDDDDDDDDNEDLCAEPKVSEEHHRFQGDNYYDKAVRALHKQWRAALKNEVQEVGYEPWLCHTFPRIDNVQWESTPRKTSLSSVADDDDDDAVIRSITCSATIFSPFQLAHALEIEHCYHRRPRHDKGGGDSWCEFYCYWHFRFVRFDGEHAGGGDDVQQALARRYPKNVILLNPTYVADEEMEVLCSNGYQDPPRVQECAQVEWVPVEDINVHNFTPNTVRRMREWLFGPPKSTSSTNALVSDFDFLRLLFASFGTPRFQTLLKGDIGYFWPMNLRQRNQLIAEGLVEKTDYAGINWLEYQARLVSGSLRLQDKYYVPYDVQLAKSVWGQRALQVCEAGTFNDDDCDEDVLALAPWLVWERAEKSIAKLNALKRFSVDELQ